MARGPHAAREKIFLYVMHAARDRIQCGPREGFFLFLLLLKIFLMAVFFYIEKKHFFERGFFRKETFFTDPARLRKICLHVAPELKWVWHPCIKWNLFAEVPPL